MNQLRLPEREYKESVDDSNTTEQIVVNLRLSPEDIIPVSVPFTKEVGYVKSVIASQLEINFDDITLTHKGAPLIDPMSFCDHPGIQPPSITVDVVIKGM